MADREEIRKFLDAVEYGVVSTIENGSVKSRAMHFAQDEEFNFYLASLKGDPKLRQMLEQPSVGLLLIKGDQGFPQAEEVEVAGAAEILRDEKERERAFSLLAKKSPIVANMKAGGALGMLEAVRVSPNLVKYRKVEEIMRGVGPKVIEFAGGGSDR